MTMKNRMLSIPGVYLSDVMKVLQERGIPHTKENIEAAAKHVELVASAYAKATLQDTSQEDWLDWIEFFKKK